MVDESLSEMDRACLLINTGLDVQKICVIGQLAHLLKTNQMDVLSRIVPKIRVRYYKYVILCNCQN